jgi:hypothetical protein
MNCKVRFCAVALLMGLAACKPEMREVSEEEYDPSKVAYYKDQRTGFCFAVAVYTRMDTAARTASGISHASVPCTPQVESLLRPPAK